MNSAFLFYPETNWVSRKEKQFLSTFVFSELASQTDIKHTKR